MFIEQIERIIKEVLMELSIFAVVRLQRTPNPTLGDLGINCMSFSQKYKVSLDVITSAIVKFLENESVVEVVSVVGPFINIKLRTQSLFSDAVRIAKEKKVLLSKVDRIMVEYVSPNTNKPLHLGHVRNGVIGSALSNILGAVGHTVIPAILINDKGVHICKSMLAYKKWGNDSTPESSGQKGDHFVGNWYVRYSQEVKVNPELEQEVNEMLLLWEKGDQEIIDLWIKMNSWVYDGFRQTYDLYGFKFSKSYYESDLYLQGKEIVLNGLKNSTFEYLNNAVVFRLDAEEFGLNPDQTPKYATLIRKDGTSVYLTQDISTALIKAEENNLDRSVYVVGSEQEHHFKVLFSILRALNYSWADNCYHLSYGMVDLPSGKMKSREGTVVDADDLFYHMSDAVKEIMVNRSNNNLSETIIEEVSKTLALAAIKFYLIRFDPKARIKFNPEESLSFHGDTGAYCLYAYVRSQRLLKNAPSLDYKSCEDFTRLGSEEERILGLNILQLPEVIKNSAAKYNPALLAEHVLKLAHSFHDYYGKEKILCDDNTLSTQRLALTSAFAESMEWGLSLLGIDVVDQM